MNQVDVIPYLNKVEIGAYINSVDLSKIDVETLRYFLSQFQITEEHKEVT